MQLINETPFEFTAVRSRPTPPGHALTVIVKATFALKDGVWAAAAKQRAISIDKPHLDDIGRSLAWASDLAPVKPVSDFFVLGTFYQPGGVAAVEGSGAVQLGGLRKELKFYGPGHAARTPTGEWMRTERTPMVSVPLRWEFSYGGLSDPRNPMGRGIDNVLLPSGREMVLLPQIEYPDDRDRAPGEAIRPANFAPLPPSFQARARRLGTRDRRWAVFRAPLPPADYDPRCHNAAPDDQQASDFAKGDETLVLVNLHPKFPELTTKLPGLRPRVGFLRRTVIGVLPEELETRLDTVVVLPDEDQLVLTWRGVITLKGDSEQGEIEWLQARIETLAEPAAFSELAAAMLAAWQNTQPKAPPPPPPPQPSAPPDISSGMAKARELLAKVTLPPELQAKVASEADPQVLFNALADHFEATLAAMQAKYKA